MVLVSVWHTATTPEFDVLESIARVEEVLGPCAQSPSWKDRGISTVTNGAKGNRNWTSMQDHAGKWERIIGQIQG